MALDKNNASRFLVPLGALLALAVAIGVWLVPSSAMDPAKPDIDPIGEEIPEPPTLERQMLPDEAAWMTVAKELNVLREPDEPTQAETKPDESGEQPGENPDEHVAPAPRVTVTWSYEGYVEQPDRVAALIRVGGVQRFVFVGEQVKDASLPPTINATIGEITPDHIVVRIDGGAQTIERTGDEGPSGVAPPSRRPPTSPQHRRRS